MRNSYHPGFAALVTSFICLSFLITDQPNLLARKSPKPSRARRAGSSFTDKAIYQVLPKC
jgi:hypothetical protein